jgi:PAS domain S-box-containing protein
MKDGNGQQIANGTQEIEQAYNMLKSSEMRYRRLFEAAQDGIILLNASTAVIEDINPYLINILGYSKEEIIGKKIWEIGSFKDTNLNKEAFLELAYDHYIRYDNLPLETKGGKKIFVEFVSNVYDCNGINIIQCNIRDNTSRHIAELALQSTTRALRIITESHSTILKAETEQKLIDDYCRLAVESGDYKFAWIGYLNTGNLKRVDLKAYYGDKQTYSDVERALATRDLPEDGVLYKAVTTLEIQVKEELPDKAPEKSTEEAILRNIGYGTFIVFPFQISEDTISLLVLYGENIATWSTPEKDLLKEVSDDIAYGIKAIRTLIYQTKYEEQLKRSMGQTIQVLADTIDQRDHYTAGHQRRVASICSQVASEMGLSEDRIFGLNLAAMIHDLGKIGIPIEILVKPLKLSESEYGLIKDHVAIGYNIIKSLSFPWPIAEMIHQHHERMDGSGYPCKLKGDALLLESKILAVADVLEAMASERPYRPALGIEVAIDEIKKNGGTLYDQGVVDACVKLFENRALKM